MTAGFVSLVGAGPGDLELLTMKAVRRLAEADVVLYDALVPLEMLALASGASCLCVGKRAGGRGVPQPAINRLLISLATRGKRVVRLKCGDPFVLGRGGEEALAVARAGIRVDVVPGITSAVAAPALAGIPVTHRGLASGFVVMSGHAEDAYRRTIASIVPGSLTLVILMGIATKRALVARLLECGWDPATPAAVLVAASTARAFTWTGPLAELSHVALEACGNDPGTIVIGPVVGVRASLVAPRQAIARPMSVADRRAESVKATNGPNAWLAAMLVMNRFGTLVSKCSSSTGHPSRTSSCLRILPSCRNGTRSIRGA
jgi:uroporphyrin-III C-methyltransferase/precorrin-2 dehydrogenase/sirohydrochlorin ferrochelatase